MTAAHCLAIEGEMTIYRAAELKLALLDALERQGDVELDLSRVSELDTAGVQLLLFAQRVARERNKVLRLAQESAAVLEVFDLLNLSGHFAEPAAGQRNREGSS